MVFIRRIFRQKGLEGEERSNDLQRRESNGIRGK